jgi:hypothetical protein
VLSDPKGGDDCHYPGEVRPQGGFGVEAPFRPEHPGWGRRATGPEGRSPSASFPYIQLPALAPGYRPSRRGCAESAICSRGVSLPPTLIGYLFHLLIVLDLSHSFRSSPRPHHLRLPAETPNSGSEPFPVAGGSRCRAVGAGKCCPHDWLSRSVQVIVAAFIVLVLEVSLLAPPLPWSRRSRGDGRTGSTRGEQGMR